MAFFSALPVTASCPALAKPVNPGALRVQRLEGLLSGFDVTGKLFACLLDTL